MNSSIRTGSLLLDFSTVITNASWPTYPYLLALYNQVPVVFSAAIRVRLTDSKPFNFTFQNGLLPSQETPEHTARIFECPLPIHCIVWHYEMLSKSRIAYGVNRLQYKTPYSIRMLNWLY